MTNLYSMTGFGKATVQLPSKKISIEIKSLNSKQVDISVRMPHLFKEKEQDIRKTLAKQLVRGKMDMSFYCEVTGVDKAPKINGTLATAYIGQLKSLVEKNGIEGDILSAVMRLPDVMSGGEDQVDEQEWKAVKVVIAEAIERLQDFRKQEGESLRVELRERLQNIDARLAKVPEFEEERINRVKEKLNRGLAEIAEKPDENRFEQELIYYLEKLDVTEEKVRLANHLKYFEELLQEGGAVGKKLGFVAQEIGREVNTLGSKANHAGMQKLVVEMKDELEKMKEQILNVL